MYSFTSFSIFHDTPFPILFIPPVLFPHFRLFLFSSFSFFSFTNFSLSSQQLSLPTSFQCLFIPLCLTFHVLSLSHFLSVPIFLSSSVFLLLTKHQLSQSPKHWKGRHSTSSFYLSSHPAHFHFSIHLPFFPRFLLTIITHT